MQNRKLCFPDNVKVLRKTRHFFFNFIQTCGVLKYVFELILMDKAEIDISLPI